MSPNFEEISYPKIDNCLYRYKPLEIIDPTDKNDYTLQRLINEIKTGNIYLSRPNRLNDPFETQYYPQNIDDKKYNVKTLLQIISNKSEQGYLYTTVFEKIKNSVDGRNQISFNDFINKSFSQFKKAYNKSKNKNITINNYKKLVQKEILKKSSSKLINISIASFSETYKSIPMWAYYANDYKGVCLEYDFTKIKSNEDKLISRIYKVSYSTNMPKNKFSSNYSPTIKSIAWSHEQEWRMIIPDDYDDLIEKDGAKYINVPYLKRVIFGTNIKELNAMKIEKVVEDLNNSRKEKIKIEMIKPNIKKYDLNSSKRINEFFRY